MSIYIAFFESGLPLKMAICLLLDGGARERSEVESKELFFGVASVAYRDHLADNEDHRLTVTQVEANYQLVAQTLSAEDLNFLTLKAMGWEAALFFKMLFITLVDPATEANLREDTRAYLGRMVERNRFDSNFWVSIDLKLLFLLYSPQFFEGNTLHSATYKRLSSFWVPPHIGINKFYRSLFGWSELNNLSIIKVARIIYQESQFTVD